MTTPRQPTSWLDRYRQAPSIYQWAIAIALGVMVWLFAEDFVWSTAARWNEENARMQTALEEGANRAELLSGVRDAIPPVGRIVVPRAEKDGTEELLRAINKVLEEQKIDKESIERQVRPGGNMAPPPELVQLVGEGTKLGKVVGEVRFSATQEKVIKVIAGLEAEEMIESISRLKLSREPSSKKVGVTLTVEAWVQLDRKNRGAR
ncbi:MAG: hypothetical protein JNL80_05860 [Phycisphaerae bacterium]|nr:hypothetical protein [Phycisphaerae bacterium]